MPQLQQKNAKYHNKKLCVCNNPKVIKQQLICCKLNIKKISYLFQQNVTNDYNKGLFVWSILKGTYILSKNLRKHTTCRKNLAVSGVRFPKNKYRFVTLEKYI
jgi:S-adenosylmethionine:tRNA-ribosyltransferase-isomerase (queuine synthetase)